jgi:hypothetical protein
MATNGSKARYALVKTAAGAYYAQETDADGNLVALCDADGEIVVEANGSSRIGNVEWTLIRDLGPVTGDTDDFFAAVETCPELQQSESLLHADYTDADGNAQTLGGDNVDELAAQLPEDYDGGSITVRDTTGSVRGWIRGRNDWTAQ